MPGEGLTHGPPATQNAGGSHHRCSQIIRHSLRGGVNAYGVLFPGTGLSCPRHLCDAKHHHRLSASVGAPEPHALAVRVSIARRAMLPRPPHPAPRS
jgi:hypothetical protein